MSKKRRLTSKKEQAVRVRVVRRPEVDLRRLGRIGTQFYAARREAAAQEQAAAGQTAAEQSDD